MQIVIQKKVNKNEAFFTNASFFCGIIKVFKLFVNFTFDISRKMRKNIEVATYYTKTNNKQKINVGLILLLH